MLKKVTTQEQIREERQRALFEVSKQRETEELLLEQMIDIEFRQSMTEMGVM